MYICKLMEMLFVKCTPILTDVNGYNQYLLSEKKRVNEEIDDEIVVKEYDKPRRRVTFNSHTYTAVDVHLAGNKKNKRIGSRFISSLTDGDILKLDDKYTCTCIGIPASNTISIIIKDNIPHINNGILSKTIPSGNIGKQIDILNQIHANTKRGLDIFETHEYDKNITKMTRFGFYSLLLNTRACNSNFDPRFNKKNIYGIDDYVKLSSNNFTDNQKNAINASLSADYFHLIHGPPGTGKTTVISEIVSNLVDQGKRVLICSWTNVAVDNVLSKIIDKNILKPTELTRISFDKKRVTENVQKIVADENLIKHYGFKKQLKLVGSTLASAHFAHSILPGDRMFDVVIVDEAGTSTITQTLLATSLGKKFILVGDHFQLPPIVINPPNEYNIDPDTIKCIETSLFEHLIDRWPEESTILDTQFRMPEAICDIANNIIYNKVGTIKTGTSPNRKTILPDDNHIPSTGLPFEDIKKLSSSTHPVVWFNVTGELTWKRNKYNKSASSAYNEKEIKVVELVYNYILNTIPGIKPHDVGIISTYRQQREELKKVFQSSLSKGLEIHTVDSFQGKEKKIIIVSMVYSPTTKKRRKYTAPMLFNDIRRFNVAFTRAQEKLIIVGDIEISNSSAKHIKHVYNSAVEKNGIIDIEKEK